MAVVAADVVVMGVFFHCAVTLVVVAVLVLGLFFWVTVKFMLSPPFGSKKGGGEGLTKHFLGWFDFG